LCEVLADSIRSFRLKIDNESENLGKHTVNISRIYDEDIYSNSKLAPINEFCSYVREKLEPYLIGAYMHGSLSTMDYTNYSDVDTLFIIKQAVLEDPIKIRKLERLFIKSTRYLYEFDPLQHHGHFFLTESDLMYYNQSFLPLTAIKLSTCILDKGNSLTFFLRNSKRESELRFTESIKIARRYFRDKSRLQLPYYYKGFLSNFMRLPVLFLQLRGEYVSKKDSFEILRERIPSDLWRCMDQVSEIRQNWDQTTSTFRSRLMKMVGMWNPLLLHFLAVNFYKCCPLSDGIPNARLLSEMYALTEYLANSGGLSEDR